MSDISYELRAATVIVPEAVTRQISGVDTLRQVMTLPAGGIVPDEGMVLIINTPTKDLPNGLLAKVKSVKETSRGYEVSYQEAELMEAFKSINIPEQYIPLNDLVEHVYDMDGTELEFSRGMATRKSGVQPIEITMPEKVLKWGGIEITPKMSIDMMMKYVLQAEDYEIYYAHCGVDADITIGADLNLKTLAEAKLLDKRIPLIRISLGVITVGPVVLTPWVQLNFLLKAEGNVTLEASISYKRTVHTGIHYEKGAGLTATMDVDPEEPDALKYTFGPKFEGGFSYGLGAGVIIGLYGKVFAMGGSLNVSNKYTISSKLDLAALEGGFKDYLEAAAFPEVALTGSKWKHMSWEGLSLNQTMVAGFSANLEVLSHKLAHFNVADVNFPIDSSPIMPQVKVDEKDFYKVADNEKDVTLTLHHVKKSVLDDLTKFRAEFKPRGSKDEKKTIVKYFNIDDETRNWLKAEVKNNDVTTNAKVTLDENESYDLTVYMNIIGIDIPIFVGEQKEEFEIRTDVKSIGIIYGVHTVGYYVSDNTESGNFDVYEDFEVSKSGKILTITGKKTDYLFYGRDNITFSINVDFSTPDAPAITNFELQSNGYRTQGERENTNVDWSLKASYIPLEKIWNYGGGMSNYVFHALEADGLKITSYSRSEEYYDGGGKKQVKSLSLTSNPKNAINVNISFMKQ